MIIILLLPFSSFVGRPKGAHGQSRKEGEKKRENSTFLRCVVSPVTAGNNESLFWAAAAAPPSPHSEIRSALLFYTRRRRPKGCY